jgi:hypothetical protein
LSRRRHCGSCGRRCGAAAGRVLGNMRGDVQRTHVGDEVGRVEDLVGATVIRCAPGEWRTIIAAAASRWTEPDTCRSSASTTKPLRFSVMMLPI